MSEDVSRRRIIEGMGVAGSAGLAGCSELEDLFDLGEAEVPDVTIMVPDGLQDDELPGDVDNPMENVIGTAPAATGPGLDFFEELYEDEYGEDPGVFNAEAYDATAVHMLAQVRAGSHEGEEIAAAVREVTGSGGEVIQPGDLAEGIDLAADGEEIEYQGASSDVEFDSNGDLAVTTPFDLFEFSEDGFSVYDTYDAEVDPEDVDLDLPEVPDDPDPIDEIRVGVIAPETGDLGDLGEPIADAAELPATQLEDEIDQDIDVRREDTETLTDVGTDRAQDLVDAGYPSITGAAASDVTLPVSQDVYTEEEVVGISPASTAPEITEVDGRYMLRTTPSDALQGVVAAEVAYEEEGFETASTLYLNDAYGEGLNDEFVAAFEDLGGEVLEEEAFEPEQPSYDSELDVVLEEEPDLLYLVGFPDSGEQIFIDFYN